MGKRSSAVQSGRARRHLGTGHRTSYVGRTQWFSMDRWWRGKAETGGLSRRPGGASPLSCWPAGRVRRHSRFRQRCWVRNVLRGPLSDPAFYPDLGEGMEARCGGACGGKEGLDPSYCQDGGHACVLKDALRFCRCLCWGHRLEGKGQPQPFPAMQNRPTAGRAWDVTGGHGKRRHGHDGALLLLAPLCFRV